MAHKPCLHRNCRALVPRGRSYCSEHTVHRPTKMSSDWPTIRARVLKRDRYQCRLCGSDEEVAVHHIIHREDGGTNSLDNLISLCKYHHQKEHRWNS